MTEGQSPAKAIPTKGFYLTGNEEAFDRFPAAPKLNSERDHTDLLITLSIQASRNDEQIDEAKEDAKYFDGIKAMDHLVDTDFETDYPETSKVGQLLKHAGDDGASVMFKLKKRNGRLRPFRQHPGLVVPLFTADDFSYPSGHASGSELQARILAELFPDRAALVLNKARLIADSRVVAGVHYESDIEAGRYLGDLIFSLLDSNPRFKHDLDVARRELAKK